jgi:hypothetical protein
LDLDVEDLNAEQLTAVEDYANAIVWENRPIYTYFVADTDLASIPLRRPPKVTGQIRIVEIEQFDWSACGGTHVRRTGEIGIVALLPRPIALLPLVYRIWAAARRPEVRAWVAGPGADGAELPGRGADEAAWALGGGLRRLRGGRGPERSALRGLPRLQQVL